MAKCHRNSINLKLINSMFAPIKLEHDFLKRCCAQFVYFWLNATLKINIIYIYIYWDSKCFRFLFKQVQHWFTLVNSKRKILKLKQNADRYLFYLDILDLDCVRCLFFLDVFFSSLISIFSCCQLPTLYFSIIIILHS